MFWAIMAIEKIEGAMGSFGGCLGSVNAPAGLGLGFLWFGRLFLL
jgi:hypothetical protein